MGYLLVCLTHIALIEHGATVRESIKKSQDLRDVCCTKAW